MPAFCPCPCHPLLHPRRRSITPRRPRIIPQARVTPPSPPSDSLLKPTDLHPTPLSDLYPNFPQWLISRLSLLGYVRPTYIQKKTLDLALPGEGKNSVGKDVVIHAQTGSGKTLAYLLPAIMAVDPSRASVQAMVVVPTQELGMQVYKVCRRIVSAFTLREEEEVEEVMKNAIFPVLPMLDQANLRRQKLQLRQLAPRIIVGNPLRILQLVQSGRLRLDLLKVLIVDEFDACLLDTTTTEALLHILAVKNREVERQTILASATVPQHKHFLRQCVRQKWTKEDITHVWVKEDKVGGSVPEAISHKYVLCHEGKKLSALRMLLERHLEKGDMRAIVFVMPSRNVNQIVTALNNNLPSHEDPFVVGLHDDLSIFDRRNSLTAFREGRARVLVATDLAARGLDIEGVTHVFQVDLPTDPDAYLHRAGRTGRRGESGISAVLVGVGERFVVDRMSNSLGVEFERLGR